MEMSLDGFHEIYKSLLKDFLTEEVEWGFKDAAEATATY